MRDRPKFFDDLAGVAGGAFSAFAGVRDEVESLVRNGIDDTIRRLDLVRREEMDAAMELAANARAGQEAAEARLAALEARVAVLEEAHAHAAGLQAAEPASTPAPNDTPNDTSAAQDIPPPMDV